LALNEANLTQFLFTLIIGDLVHTQVLKAVGHRVPKEIADIIEELVVPCFTGLPETLSWDRDFGGWRELNPFKTKEYNASHAGHAVYECCTEEATAMFQRCRRSQEEEDQQPEVPSLRYLAAALRSLELSLDCTSVAVAEH